MVGFAHGDIWSFSAGTKIEAVWLQNAKLDVRKQWLLWILRVCRLLAKLWSGPWGTCAAVTGN